MKELNFMNGIYKNLNQKDDFDDFFDMFHDLFFHNLEDLYVMIDDMCFYIGDVIENEL